MAEKLLQIRLALNLSQNGMLEHLGLTEDLYRNNISSYERGEREPPLHALLKYARAAGVWVDVLIDDELNLPEKLPSSTKHEGIKRASAARSKKH
ncbi:MAG: helix-turn-helix domain-containing protein [Acidobacteria bacterium]|nr:helix-turn-helix domain-containing protein [Acidobacteriota bacterium]